MVIEEQLETGEHRFSQMREGTGQGLEQIQEGLVEELIGEESRGTCQDKEEWEIVQSIEEVEITVVLPIFTTKTPMEATKATGE